VDGIGKWPGLRSITSASGSYAATATDTRSSIGTTSTSTAARKALSFTALAPGLARVVSTTAASIAGPASASGSPVSSAER